MVTAVPFEYFYLVLSLSFIVAWVVFFLLGKYTRREQLLMSLWFTPLGPLSEIFFLQDYWTPSSVWSVAVGPVTIMVEDLLFSFAITGIATVVYKVLFRKRLEESTSAPSPLNMVSVLLVPIIVAVAIWALTDLNSVFAASAGLGLLAALVIWQRRDLFPATLITGILFTAIVAILYLIYFYVIDSGGYEEHLARMWMLVGTPLDVRIARIPLTELIWAFTSGLAAGPFYAFATGRRIVKV